MPCTSKQNRRLAEASHIVRALCLMRPTSKLATDTLFRSHVLHFVFCEVRGAEHGRGPVLERLREWYGRASSVDPVIGYMGPGFWLKCAEWSAKHRRALPPVVATCFRVVDHMGQRVAVAEVQ